MAQNAITIYRAAQHRLRGLFAEFTASHCPTCPTPCCRQPTWVRPVDVILVEDIVDTGLTLSYLLKYLEGKGPASLKVCTLLDKRVRRLVDIPLDYVGFEIPDEFVVGYGLDYLAKYRNLPFIGILRPQASAE